VRRINVSLDSLDPDRFRFITRGGDWRRCWAASPRPKAAGLAVKINMVALKGLNEDEIEPMLRWCAAEGHDLTLIETMPLGEIEEDRTDRYLPLDGCAARWSSAGRWRRSPIAPAARRAISRVEELDAKIGFITPLTKNFCDGCNRVRLTARASSTCASAMTTGRSARGAARGRSDGSTALDRAMRLKPLRHISRSKPKAPATIARHMSVTGG
jgi:cyclic pyranopterin phosphate synthase